MNRSFCQILMALVLVVLLGHLGFPTSIKVIYNKTYKLDRKFNKFISARQIYHFNIYFEFFI